MHHIKKQIQSYPKYFKKMPYIEKFQYIIKTKQYVFEKHPNYSKTFEYRNLTHERH